MRKKIEELLAEKMSKGPETERPPDESAPRNP